MKGVEKAETRSGRKPQPHHSHIHRRQLPAPSFSLSGEGFGQNHQVPQIYLRHLCLRDSSLANTSSESQGAAIQKAHMTIVKTGSFHYSKNRAWKDSLRLSSSGLSTEGVDWDVQLLVFHWKGLFTYFKGCCFQVKLLVEHTFRGWLWSSLDTWKLGGHHLHVNPLASSKHQCLPERNLCTWLALWLMWLPLCGCTYGSSGSGSQWGLWLWVSQDCSKQRNRAVEFISS